MQPWPVGQPSAGVFVPGPQGGKSLSHCGGGVPPSVPASGGAQSAGIVGLPMQISQRSHGFEHWVTCVQAGHLAGLPKSAAVQVAASLIGVGAPGTSAAAEAVAAVRNELAAEVDAGLRLRGRRRALHRM